MTSGSGLHAAERAVGRHAASPRRRGLTVALVGADGAGKSSVSREIRSASLPRPVRTIYMGVNLEASSLMLPTTRLLLAAKRLRGGRPDMVASPLRTNSAARPTSYRGRLASSVRNVTRLVVWALEEWLRVAVAIWHQLRGRLVVFDRHFVADYWDSDIAPSTAPRSRCARVHGWMLRRLYPEPDLTVCLDAPAAVLYARKPEASVEWLEQRRQQYLAIAAGRPDVVVVDATQPFDAVLDDVVRTIRHRWEVAR